MRRSVRTSAYRASLRALGRAVALALFALFAGAHVLPAVHHAMVRHVICAVHGDLQHADEAEAASPSRERDAFPAISESHAVHLDEHCSVLAAPSERATEIAAPARTRAPHAARQRPLPPGAERARSSLPVLAFAPKLAPPA